MNPSEPTTQDVLVVTRSRLQSGRSGVLRVESSGGTIKSVGWRSDADGEAKVRLLCADLPVGVPLTLRAFYEDEPTKSLLERKVTVRQA